MSAEAAEADSPTIIGIDLGTTNSLVAVVEKGVPVVLSDPQTASALVPSVVYFPPAGGAPVVGEAAKAHLSSEPERTVYSAKRLMGRGYVDAAHDAASLPYRLSPERESVATIDLGGGALVTPPEVGAHVLRTLKERAEAHLGKPATQAVITVPAYFNDAQRQATKDAGEIAGLEVLRIVNEPTAASLAYGLQNRQTATIAVYDLGGGTFDVSLLRLEDGLFEVLATGGDTHLGGDDFDAALVELLRARGVAGSFSDLRLLAERVKIGLSDRDLVSATSEVEVTRAEFEAAVAPLIERTLTACRQVLTDASLTAPEVDEIVLVGGSTRVPAVRRAVGDLFGRAPHTRLNPDEVVALGAAVQADVLSGNRPDLLLLDVTPLSLGIETMGGAVEKLIYRNSKVPSTAREEFTTSVDGQTAVLLHVVQGEREMARDNRSLARIELRGVPPMPAGIPKVEVTFLLDANGILNVSAREVRSGVATEVRVKPTYGLEDTEVRRMVRDSFRYADEDFKERMLADMRNEADSAIHGADKLLSAYSEDLPPTVRDAIAADLATLRDARDNAEEHSTVREALDRFEQTARPLAERAMSGIARDLVAGKTLAEAAEDLDRRKEGE